MRVKGPVADRGDAIDERHGRAGRCGCAMDSRDFLPCRRAVMGGLPRQRAASGVAHTLVHLDGDSRAGCLTAHRRASPGACTRPGSSGSRRLSPPLPADVIGVPVSLGCSSPGSHARPRRRDRLRLVVRAAKRRGSAARLHRRWSARSQDLSTPVAAYVIGLPARRGRQQSAVHTIVSVVGDIAPVACVAHRRAGTARLHARG
jgi:hypothetical protein